MDIIRSIIANRVPHNEPLFHSSQNFTPGLSQQTEASIHSSQYFPQRHQQLQQARVPYKSSDTKNVNFGLMTPSTTRRVPPTSQASTFRHESPPRSIRSMIVETPKYVARRIRLAFGLEPKADNGVPAQEKSLHPVNTSENKPVDYEIKASLDILGRNVANLRNELQNRTAATEVQVDSVPFSKYVQMAFGKVFKLHTHGLTKFTVSNSEVKDALLRLCKTTESISHETRAVLKSLEATNVKILQKLSRKKAVVLTRKICRQPQFSQFRKLKRLKPKPKKANCPRKKHPHFPIRSTQLSPEIPRMVPASTTPVSPEVPRVIPAISNTEVNPRMVPASNTSVFSEVPRVIPTVSNTEVNPRLVPVSSTTSIASEVPRVMPAITNAGVNLRMVPVSNTPVFSEVPRVIPAVSNTEVNPRMVPASNTSVFSEVPRVIPTVSNTEVNPRLVPVSSTTSIASEVPRVMPAITNAGVNLRMVPVSNTPVFSEVPRVIPAVSNTEVNPLVPASTTSIVSEVPRVIPEISNTEVNPHKRATKEIAKRILSGMESTSPDSKKCKEDTQYADLDDEFSVVYESVSSVPQFGSLLRITRNWLRKQIGLNQPKTPSTQSKEKILSGKKTIPQVLTATQNELPAGERQNQSVQSNTEPIAKPGPRQQPMKKSRGRSRKAASKEN